MTRKFKIYNKCAVSILIVLIFLSCMTCIYAENLNDTDDELTLGSNEMDALGNAENDDGDILTSVSESTTNSQAFLILDNDADIENIHIGDYVTWIISVLNKGPDTAKNVKVHDQLPDGLKYIKHTATKGTFNPKTGIWDIGDLSIDDGEVFLNITTKALTAGEKINKANLTTDSENLNNNESYEEEEIDVVENEPKLSAKAIDPKYSSGNPIALIILSLFAILITSVKSK